MTWRLAVLAAAMFVYGGAPTVALPRQVMLSSRAKYAIRAALHLAERYPEAGWVPTAEIAERESIPRKFLEAILVDLRTNGMLESRRGPGGGHRLRLRPELIAVADIMRVVDGPLALTPCASRTQFRACADCPDLAACRIRGLMQRARDAVAGVLEESSLADLIQPATVF
jgi:Rrf2 family protein